MADLLPIGMDLEPDRGAGLGQFRNLDRAAHTMLSSGRCLGHYPLLSGTSPQWPMKLPQDKPNPTLKHWSNSTSSPGDRLPSTAATVST